MLNTIAEKPGCVVRYLFCLHHSADPAGLRFICQYQRFLRRFQCQQKGFDIQPARKAGQLAVGPNHAVARCDNRERITPIGRPDGSHRQRMADLPRNLAVAARLTKRDRHQRLPDFF